MKRNIAKHGPHVGRQQQIFKTQTTLSVRGSDARAMCSTVQKAEERQSLHAQPGRSMQQEQDQEQRGDVGYGRYHPNQGVGLHEKSRPLSASRNLSRLRTNIEELLCNAGVPLFVCIALLKWLVVVVIVGFKTTSLWERSDLLFYWSLILVRK